MMKSDLKTGMIVTLRRGVTRIVIGKYLVDDDVNICNILENYNDDLTHMNNCNSEDIIKIEYGGKVIWDRVDWDKVPFGTKVRVLDCEEDKLVGRFIYYEECYDVDLPFLVFVESEREMHWFKNCEIIEEGEDE